MTLKIRRLLAGDIKTEILHKIGTAEEIRIAVAWAQCGHEVELALRANAKKIQKIVVGMDFNGTDPAFLGFYGKHHLALGRATGTFHPKIYYFRSGKWAACIEGSSNFTKSAFERNAESGTLITGHWKDPFFERTRFLIDQYAEHGAILKPSELRSYETISRALKKREKKQKKLQKKLQRRKEKEQAKKRRKEAKKLKKALAKRRRKEQKRQRQKKHFIFFKKRPKRRKGLFSWRLKLMLLLAALGALFYNSPPLQQKLHLLRDIPPHARHILSFLPR